MTPPDKEYQNFMRSMGFQAPKKQYTIRYIILWSVIAAIVSGSISVFTVLKIDEYSHKQNAIFMRVTPYATCIRNNSVGDSWEVKYKLNGRDLPSFLDAWSEKVWQGAKISTETTITELDSIDDVSTEKTVYKVTEEDLRQGFKIKQTVIITENRGQYAGNTARWEVIYTFEPAK